MLLAWSKHAAASHFVEREWTTALALRKIIFPCFLDKTPHPPALSAINGIEMHPLEGAVPKLIQALQRSVATTDAARRMDVLDRSQEVGSADPAAVVEAVLEWPATKGQMTILKKWQTWAVCFGSLVMVAALWLGLWDRVGEKVIPWPCHEHVMQTLSGMIWDEYGETLAGVEVTLPEFNLNQMTDSTGRFSFQVKAPQQRHVRLIAQKNGYRTYYGDRTLGYTSVGFTMRRGK